MHFLLCWVFVAVSRSYSVLAVPGFLWLQDTGSRARALQWLRCMVSTVVAPGLSSTGSVLVVLGLSCSAACGIFPGQGLNPCPLCWQADSLTLSHQGSPILFWFFLYLVIFVKNWTLKKYNQQLWKSDSLPLGISFFSLLSLSLSVLLFACLVTFLN